MIVLDTHAWVLWVSDPARIPAPARAAIHASLDADVPVGVSSISVWEVAMLVARARLELTMDVAEWVHLSESAPEIAFIPVDNRIALRAVALDGFPQRDPADRIIAATALETAATLVTADAKLRACEPLTTLWD